MEGREQSPWPDPIGDAVGQGRQWVNIALGLELGSVPGGYGSRVDIREKEQ